MALTEIANESIGKSIWQIRNFFQEMVTKGELKVQTILRTRSEIKLQLADKIEEQQPAILTYLPTSADYFFNTISVGGIFSEDGDQNQYQNAILLRLRKRFTSKMVEQGFQGPYISDKFILAKLHIFYIDHWHDAGDIDVCSYRTGRLTLKGQPDELIQKLHEYLRR